MTKSELIQQIKEKNSYLCVGLDSAIEKIPAHLNGDVVAFNKAIIEATAPYCVSYKVNTAFYESRGLQGWKDLEATLDLIPKTHLSIADAKRGDIGNTSDQYAKAFFETLAFDALTVAPYMGKDSLASFLEYKNKWTIVLGLTSNKGAEDFEMLDTPSGKVYEEVIKKVSSWAGEEQLMFVTGATQARQLGDIRKMIPNHFLLIPGVGAQGGSLEEISKQCMTEDIGMLVNSSRSIIFASSQEDFAQRAADAAQALQKEMTVMMQQTMK